MTTLLLLVRTAHSVIENAVEADKCAAKGSAIELWRLAEQYAAMLVKVTGELKQRRIDADEHADKVAAADAKTLVDEWHAEWRWGNDPSFNDLRNRVTTAFIQRAKS